MSGDDTSNEDRDSADALIGTPVEQSRRMQGLSQEDYLKLRSGENTLQQLELAGLARRSRRRALLWAVGVGLACGVLLLWWLLS